ncbi:MAG: HAMP domain-containing protein [Candidatus Riflebacteria bacterium]|nr:HAMP domain-containing protein [Candidatus Riflebacteria bacterium]
MKRLTGFGIIAAVILLVSVFLLIIDHQEQRLRSLNRSAYLAEVQSWLPAMNQIIAADNLAAIKIMRILNSFGKLNSQSVKTVAALIKGEFGNSARFVISDAQLQATESLGFNELDYEIWLDFFRLYQKLNTQGRISFPGNVTSLVEKYLGVSFDLIYVENFLAIYSGNFEDNRGLIFVGSHMSDKMPKQVVNRFTHIKHGEMFDKCLLGYYLIFLPKDVYTNVDWYCKNQDLLLPNADSKIFTGDTTELQELFRQHGYEAAARSFAEESAVKSNGVFAAENQAFSFCANPLISKDNNARIFSVIVTNIPDLKLSPSNNLLKIIIIVSLLLMIFLCVNNLEKQRFFSLSISRHFSWLAVSACFLPILALLFQAFSQQHVQNLQARSEILNKLESKLTLLENNYQSRLEKMLLSVQLFHERCVAGDRPIQSLVDEYSDELSSHSVREFYVCDRAGKIDLFRVNQPRAENIERSKEGARLMRLLVQFIQHNVKFTIKNAKMSVKDGLIIESVSELIGPESLYRLTMQHNQLLTFKALYGATWLINFFQYDENKVPIKFYMYIISRAPFQERMVDEWQSTNTLDYPEYMLANQNVSFHEKLTPVWLENRPEYVRFLRHLNSVGGAFRTDFAGEGRKYLGVGRSLRDIDWSIVALERLDGDKQAISRTSFLLFSSIIFLMLIIAVISRYFSRIFLVPVRQLSLSVAAMADGNYDLRMDVTSHDEIGQLCENFNSMAAGLKEKEYLNRFLSDIARDAISGKVSQRATRVEGTILFSDIRDFTTMTEQKSPEEIVQMLNEFMTEAEVVVTRHSGTIEKFIGDAIMVVFLPILGAAVPAVRATHAAEDLLLAITRLNERRKSRGLFSIAIGAGVATGSLLMGAIGNQQGRRDYSVTGKIVLRAAAMEKLTRQAVGKKIVLCPLSAELVLLSEIKTKMLKTADKETGYELL